MNYIKTIASMALAMAVSATALAETNEYTTETQGAQAVASPVAMPTPGADILQVEDKKDKSWRLHLEYYPEERGETSLGVYANASIPVFLGVEYLKVDELKDDSDNKINSYTITLSAGWEDRIFLTKTFFLEGRAGFRWHCREKETIEFSKKMKDLYSKEELRKTKEKVERPRDGGWGVTLNPRVGARVTERLELAIGYRWDFYKLKLYNERMRDYFTLSTTFVF